MSMTSTKRGLKRNRAPTSTGLNQRQAALEAVSKRLLLGNNGAGKPRKKTRKKLSHQQASQVRDTLDAEFRDLRGAGTIQNTIQDLQLPDDTAVITPSPPLKTVLEVTGFGTSSGIPEQSVQDLAGILSAL